MRKGADPLLFRRKDTGAPLFFQYHHQKMKIP